MKEVRMVMADDRCTLLFVIFFLVSCRWARGEEEEEKMKTDEMERGERKGFGIYTKLQSLNYPLNLSTSHLLYIDPELKFYLK